MNHYSSADTISPTSNNTTHQEATKPEKRLSLKDYIEIDNAIRRSDFPFLQKYVEGLAAADKKDEVNLSKDPLLNVMIAYGSKKTDSLVLKLIKTMPEENLMAKNILGDTALHVAAAKDSLAVATALIEKRPDLMTERNNKQETPLLKAVLFGSANTSRMLTLQRPQSINDRTSTGANVLHYAILGNNSALALEIVQDYQRLMYNMNSDGVSPLELITTIPELFQSNITLGLVESFLYTFIPLDNRDEFERKNKYDEEFGKYYPILHNYWVDSIATNNKLLEELEATSSRNFLKNNQLIWYFFNIVKIVGYYLDAIGVRHFIIYILKKLFNRVQELELLKKNHVQTMKLIAYLARDPDYWDFINKGMFDKEQTAMTPDDELEDFDFDGVIDNRNALLDDSNEITTSSLPTENRTLEKLIKELLMQKKTSLPTKRETIMTRWVESPLIVGAKMGLYDFVEQILKVYPESAQYRDCEGRNVLQVAINNGHVKIVKIIDKLTKGPNPVLPSWLLSHVNYDDVKMGNMSILHYAAVTTIKEEGFALQMQREIKWFEMVKKLVPKDMVYNKNGEGKTAQKLFSENHADMMKNGRNELKEIGKTCAGLLAAVVFATSFNMPQGKDSNSSTSSNNNMTANYSTAKGSSFNDESVGFKVFSHAYVIGLSFATSSLLLFLSLVTSNYREGAFRTLLPTKYILAVASFFFGLLALLVAFTCNIYLSIYGAGSPKAKNLLPLILELTAFPFLCTVALFLGGFSLPFSDFILRIFHK